MASSLWHLLPLLKSQRSSGSPLPLSQASSSYTPLNRVASVQLPARFPGQSANLSTFMTLLLVPLPLTLPSLETLSASTSTSSSTLMLMLSVTTSTCSSLPPVALTPLPSSLRTIPPPHQASMVLVMSTPTASPGWFPHSPPSATITSPSPFTVPIRIPTSGPASLPTSTFTPEQLNT